METDNGKPLPGQNILLGTFERNKYYRVILYLRLTEEQKTDLDSTVSKGSREDIQNYFNRIFQPLTDYCETLKTKNPKVIRSSASIGIKTASFIIEGIKGNHARKIPSLKNYTIEKWVED